MSNSLFPSRSQTAYQQYNQELSDAITSRDWVYDPSYALANDRDVYKKVLRDPVAAHAIRFRKHLIAGRDWVIAPGGDKPEDKLAASVVEELLKSICGFSDARLRLASAVMRGSSYEFIEGRREVMSVAGSPFMRWWRPTKLVNVDRRRFRLVPCFETSELHWEIWSVRRREWNRLDHPEWFVRSVVDNAEDSLTYGRGLMDSLYTFQANKSRVLRDAMRASARFGMGFLTAAIQGIRGGDGRPVMSQGRDGDTLAQEWATVLHKHLSEGVLVYDSRDEVKTVTGWNEGYQLLMELMKYFDAAQVLSVLGATVNTMSFDGGSFALAKEQANSTEALVNTDRDRLSDDLTRDLIGLIWRLNRFQLKALGLAGAALPRFRIVPGKRQDPSMWAQVISTLIASGIRLKAEEVYEKTGFSIPSEEDEVVEGAPAATPSDPLEEIERLGGFGARIAPGAA